MRQKIFEKIDSLKDVDSPRYQKFCRTPPRSEDIAHRSAVTGFSGKTKENHKNKTYLSDL